MSSALSSAPSLRSIRIIRILPLKAAGLLTFIVSLVRSAFAAMSFPYICNKYNTGGGGGGGGGGGP